MKGVIGMINSKALFELRDKRCNLNGKFEAYDSITRMAVDNARLSIANGQLDVAETWINLVEHCNQKIAECKKQLEDLEATLNEMKERDLA